MKFNHVFRYVDGGIESEIAMRQRRVALVGLDELSVIADLTFTGGSGEEAQSCIDAEITRAVALQFNGTQYVDNPELRQLTELVLGKEEAGEVRAYAEARAKQVKTLTETTESRSAPTGREPMYYVGVWEPKARYSRNAVATHAGTIWFCTVDATTDRPGSSPAWKMMAKSHGKHESLNAGVAA